MSATQLPAYLQQYAAAVSQDADAMTAVKTSVPRISLKGKRFKFINGEEESKGTSEIFVTILAVDPPGGLMAKTFYKGGYNPADTSPPDCQSANGIHPDSWVSDPIAERCASCPNNMFGSATSMAGKKSKACKDSKVLWVAKPDDISGSVYGLRIPVTSLKAMSEFGKAVKATGAPLAAIITKLSMDEDNEFPLLQFEIAGFLNEEQGTKAIQRSQEREFVQQDTAPAIEHKAAKQITHTVTQGDVIDHNDGSATAETAEDIVAGWGG